MTAQPVVDAIALLRYFGGRGSGNRYLDRRAIAVAKELSYFEAIRSLNDPTACPKCGGDVVQHNGRGRPRTYCTTCRPSTVREIPEKFDQPGG